MAGSKCRIVRELFSPEGFSPAVSQIRYVAGKIIRKVNYGF